MKFSTLEDYIKQFFEENREFLELNYPGITINRLKDDLRSFCGADFNEIYISENQNRIEQFLMKVKKGIPLEYISGKSYFYRSEFYVNENVLIPRSETEILVEYVSEYIRKNKLDGLEICDIGTGSGAIAISLASEMENCSARILATDISTKALEVASANKFFQRYRYPKSVKIEFRDSDRFEKIDEHFDIIISNPPYIKEDADLSEVHGQVHSFEPHLALYLKDSEYDKWFSDFFLDIEKHLKPGGLFIMEGSELHLERLQDTLNKNNFTEIELIKDYTDRFRFLRAIRK